jgi:hypothetical protein
MAKEKKIEEGGFGPWGWPQGPRGWFDHPQWPKPLLQFFFSLALRGGSATPNGQNPNHAQGPNPILHFFFYLFIWPWAAKPRPPQTNQGGGSATPLIFSYLFSNFF